MDARTYLEQLKTLDVELRMIDCNIEQARIELHKLGDVSVTSSWPDGQPHGTKVTDPTGTTAIKQLDKYRQKRQALIKRLQMYEYEQIIKRSQLWSKRLEITETLSKVKDDTSRELLYLRYVEQDKYTRQVGLQWEVIAVKMHYSYNWVNGELHRRALAALQEVLDEAV